MDFLQFFAIVEADRDVLNPVSPEKLARVAEYAGLRDGLTVLDIGSGKGAMLRQWAERWDLRGTGLELNSSFVEAARSLAQSQEVTARLRFWEGKALDYAADPDGYDVVTCLGAPFAIGTFSEALAWMARHRKPGGRLVIGDVYLRTFQTPAHLDAAGWAGLPTLEERGAEVRAQGLSLLGLSAASVDDWDHYSSLMWGAAHRWAQEHPDHPDRAELLERVRGGRERYLRWEREHLGWAVWVAG